MDHDLFDTALQLLTARFRSGELSDYGSGRGERIQYMAEECARAAYFLEKDVKAWENTRRKENEIPDKD